MASENTPEMTAKEETTLHRQVLQDAIGNAAVLPTYPELHPCGLRPFQRLEKALQTAAHMVRANSYPDALLGVFAKDIGQSGAKCWYVDTFAGFSLANAPTEWSATGRHAIESLQFHAYEVLREDRPCWLYFDLEYAVHCNRMLKSDSLMRTFYELLNSFCQTTFAANVDPNDVWELDSTTSTKFSRHIIMKSMKSTQQSQAAPRPLAFRNNLQVGTFVKKFLQYAASCRRDPASTAAQLFVRTDSHDQEVPVIDTSVYSRNRCFRVMFSTKLGKRAPLLPAWAVPEGKTPSELLLESLASFVPERTSLFEDPFILAARREVQRERRGELAGFVPFSLTRLSSHPSTASSRQYPHLALPYLPISWTRSKKKSFPRGVRLAIDVDDRHGTRSGHISLRWSESADGGRRDGVDVGKSRRHSLFEDPFILAARREVQRGRRGDLTGFVSGDGIP